MPSQPEIVKSRPRVSPQTSPSKKKKRGLFHSITGYEFPFQIQKTRKDAQLQADEASERRRHAVGERPKRSPQRRLSHGGHKKIKRKRKTKEKEKQKKKKNK